MAIQRISLLSRPLLSGMIQMQEINGHKTPLKALCKQGHLKNALHILHTTYNSPVGSCTHLQLLQIFMPKNALSEVKKIHSHINERGFSSAARIFLQNTLINMYAKCGSVVGACGVFESMTERDIFSWNMMIAAYQRHGFPQEALTFFRQMQLSAIQPDKFTFATILPSCAKLGALEQGMEIHQRIMESRFLSDVVLVNALIDMYAKCKSIHNARELFDKMPQRDAVSWNAIISGYAQNELVEKSLEIFQQMQVKVAKPDSTTFSSIVSACAKLGFLEYGMEIHRTIAESGFLSDVKVANSLITMYGKCGSLQKAEELFGQMSQRSAVSWNALISGYAQNGLTEKALEVFTQMQLEGVKLNSATLASILQACAKIGAVEEGMEVHRRTVESGFLLHDIVVTALMDMYAKCGSVQKSHKLFRKIRQQDVVSWTTIITGYTQNGFVEKSLQIFKQMQLGGIKPNSTTFASILPAYSKMGALEQGMEIHQKVIENGFLSDIVVVTTLINMYAKCGSIQKARDLFEETPQVNLVSWNTLIVGYAQNGLVEEALEIFKQMQLADAKPDSSTLANILPVCGKLGALGQGMEIHQRIIKSRCLSDVVLVTALIDMYAKCGNIMEARKLFDKLHNPNSVSWTVMIAGYAMHGYCKEAIKLFELIKHSTTNPGHIDFVCVLYACSHAGLVDEGCNYFNEMSNSYSITPTMDHYVCIIDLLGRAGYLGEALNFIIKMPIQPEVVVWMCLVGSCRSHKNVNIGEFVATLLFELDLRTAAPYVLLSNIYAEVGRWVDVQKVRKIMKDRETIKIPGCSWIEVNKMVHAFCVGDRSHPQTHEIYAMLEKLSWEMKGAGYIPNKKSVLNDVEEEEKELFICHHSEKLAIAYGLLKMPPGTTIRVVKNLRVCGDCHMATKFICKITAREIVVRDANRFHHFKNGQCSCGDYW
ncbi:pentatricopeptide repeat-containing protein At4g30700-like [Cryptomeria japonica]|uniref:pentatricopeptide repeat-containing protein At4g30700-like n=1 Tax=Cryptomeria japonica TaxID=3369 RepID=UPI0027DA67AF|nr:pentatricopeptide repeat-containing protein At4g30700-like [Cryptomeria japonica]